MKRRVAKSIAGAVKRKNKFGFAKAAKAFGKGALIGVPIGIAASIAFNPRFRRKRRRRR